MSSFRRWVNVFGGVLIGAVLVFAGYSEFFGAEEVEAPQAVAPVSNDSVQSAVSPPAQPSAAVAVPMQQVAEDSAARSRCIGQARTQGYRNGQCAFTFIDVCIRTQSRQQMEDALRTDAMLGMGTARSCPNMPSTYAAEFDRY